MKISVSMITLNEGEYIGRALSSCSFADEIVVVDGGSTDETLSILKKHPKVKIIENPWKNHFAKQRQVGLEHCSGDWIIRLDADEAYSEELENKIREILSSAPPEISCFKIHQCNLIHDENYYSKLWDNYENIPRIWKNLPGVKWENQVHEVLSGLTGQIGLLDLYVVHYGFLDKKRLWQKGEQYSRIEGSGFKCPEDLVYRDCDVQYRPPKSIVSSNVPPYPVNQSSGQPKVAILRGPNLNLWEMQNYEPLLESFDLTAYTTTKPNFDISHIKLPITKLPSHPQNIAYMLGLEAELLDKDIIYSADITWIFTYQAVMSKQKFGKKIVALEWENIPFAYEENDQIKTIKQINRQWIDAYIAVTQRAKQALILEGVPEERIEVIPMGIDIQRFRPDPEGGRKVRKELGINPEETVLLFTGRMVWEKGIYDFIYAVKLILKDIPRGNLKIIIVGKGPEIEPIKNRAKEMGIEANCLFIESFPYHQIQFLYNAADIFVLPSISTRMWKEQFGMVLIEAMACGLPVISTTSGSIPEVVGEAGILVQANDPQELGKAMLKLVQDKRLREELSARGRERAVNEFDSKKIARKIGRLFENLLPKDTRVETMPKIPPAKKPPGYYTQDRPEILAKIPTYARRVLDIGCGAGYLGKKLKEKRNIEVVGIELEPEAAEEAQKHLDRVIIGNVENAELPYNPEYFDVLIFADILEHLRNPQEVIEKYTRYLAPDGVIVASIPNVRYFEIINQLVEGRWTYKDFGILDNDHIRFFTLAEMQNMFNSEKLQISELLCNIDPKFNQLKTTYPAEINIGRITLRNMTEGEVKDLFIFQYIIVVKKTTKKDPTKKNLTLAEEINIFLQEKKYLEAKEIIEERLRSHPYDVEILIKSAELYIYLQKFDLALKNIEKACSLHPNVPEILELQRRIKNVAQTTLN